MPNKFLRRRVLAFSVLGAIIVGGPVAYLNRSHIRTAIEQFMGNDFPGPGHGETTIVIAEGSGGDVIAKQLVDAGVVKSFQTTYKMILAQNPTFYPGTFNLKLEMSSQQAIDALSNPDSAVLTTIVIREGLRSTAIFDLLAESTGIDRSEFVSLYRDPASFSLPAGFPTLEGFMFPATYRFAPDASAKTILQTMVDRMRAELGEFGVKDNDALEVLTLASVIQKEARLEPDFYKVSRVFVNRIKEGMHLQSDATVSYGVNGTTVSTTDAERANDNPYNTYLYPGLPVGPISAPGSVAIDAALHPVSGKWLYFCTINLETGETVFSDTWSQHERAVAQWQAWMKDHPQYE
ncbi:MAG: hypothetical protein RIQ31_409 [Actinomycetota bacterium]|jgi:UPF0755 protein